MNINLDDRLRPGDAGKLSGIVTVLVIILLALGAVWGIRRGWQKLQQPSDEDREMVKRQLVQEPARDFQLTALSGQYYRLSSMHGKVVVVAFWATWCQPCMEEMPQLVAFYKRQHENGLEILAISEDEEDKLKTYLAEHELPFPVFREDAPPDTEDPNALGSIAQLYGVGGIPTMFFIDQSGDLRFRLVGYSPGSAKILDEVVREISLPSS